MVSHCGLSAFAVVVVEQVLVEPACLNGVVPDSVAAFFAIVLQDFLSHYDASQDFLGFLIFRN